MPIVSKQNQVTKIILHRDISFIMMGLLRTLTIPHPGVSSSLYQEHQVTGNMSGLFSQHCSPYGSIFCTDTLCTLCAGTLWTVLYVVVLFVLYGSTLCTGVGRLTHWHAPFNSLHCLAHYTLAIQKPVSSDHLVCPGHVPAYEKNPPLNSGAHSVCPTHLFPKLVRVTTITPRFNYVHYKSRDLGKLSNMPTICTL